MEKEKKNFICCEKCGKKLIQRLPNGLWSFCFGRNPDGMGGSPVEMLIHGSLKLKCLRRTCRAWNTLNYFPMKNVFEHTNGDHQPTKPAAAQD